MRKRSEIRTVKQGLGQAVLTASARVIWILCVVRAQSIRQSKKNEERVCRTAYLREQAILDVLQNGPKWRHTDARANKQHRLVLEHLLRCGCAPAVKNKRTTFTHTHVTL